MSDTVTRAARVAILTAVVTESNERDRYNADVLAAAMRREARALAEHWDIDPKIVEGLVRE